MGNNAQTSALKSRRQKSNNDAILNSTDRIAGNAKTGNRRNVNVYSNIRAVLQPESEISDDLKLNVRNKMEGLEFLRKLPSSAFPAAFFDPQYRGVLDYLAYGNEGNRMASRSSLIQMTDLIPDFVCEISRVLMPSGHLFLWMDKFHLVTGFQGWLEKTPLKSVDMITWEKPNIGMGYRTRRKSEFLVVAQKSPNRAKGVWTRHDIPDVWPERAVSAKSVHPKPEKLQRALIEAVTNEGDTIIDPAAGTFSVMRACLSCNRNFLGCDING